MITIMNWIDDKIERAIEEQANYLETASSGEPISYLRICRLRQEGMRPAWNIYEDLASNRKEEIELLEKLARNRENEIDLLEELQDQERG